MADAPNLMSVDDEQLESTESLHTSMNAGGNVTESAMQEVMRSRPPSPSPEEVTPNARDEQASVAPQSGMDPAIVQERVTQTLNQ